MYVDSCNTIEISSSWVLTAIGIAVGQVNHKDRDYIIQALTDWHLMTGWKCARIRVTTVPVTKNFFKGCQNKKYKFIRTHSVFKHFLKKNFHMCSKKIYNNNLCKIIHHSVCGRVGIKTKASLSWLLSPFIC